MKLQKTGWSVLSLTLALASGLSACNPNRNTSVMDDRSVRPNSAGSTSNSNSADRSQPGTVASPYPGAIPNTGFNNQDASNVNQDTARSAPSGMNQNR